MITREQKIVQSTQDFVKDALSEANYWPQIVDIRDSFPTEQERSAELRKTAVATGFSFDDGGRKIEMGSDLTQRIHSVEFWTFATTATQGENIAHFIRSILEDSGLIPLKDLAVDGAPIVDQLIIMDERGVRVERQFSRDPRPWDRYVWNTTVKIEDIYYPSRDQ